MSEPSLSQPALRGLHELPPFVPYFTDEEGFGAVYPELFADPGLGLLKSRASARSSWRRSATPTCAR